MQMSEKYRKRFAFQWNYQTFEDSANGKLIRYLQKGRIRPLRELMLQALRSYWLPIALEEQGDYSQEELQEFAEEAVYELRRQADYIAFKFKVESFALPGNSYQQMLPVPQFIPQPLAPGQVVEPQDLRRRGWNSRAVQAESVLKSILQEDRESEDKSQELDLELAAEQELEQKLANAKYSDFSW